MAAATGSVSFYFLILVFLMSTCECQRYGTLGYSRISDVDIDCVQCNMRQLGIMNTCDNPAQRHNCTGCMKTLTKIRIKDSGDIYGKYRTSEVVSRYCMRHGATNAKEEGCYWHRNNGGYTVQCFCYTHNCNSPASGLSPGVLPVVFGLLMVAMTTRISRLTDFGGI